MELYTRDFTYELPENKIALYPAAQRDQSKLLYYHNGTIDHHTFQDITALIETGTMLVFNNSKVIPARLRLKNSTGATIEVFLLQPGDKLLSAQELMQRPSPVQWICTIGNKKKWKTGAQLHSASNGITLNAKLIDELNNVVEFEFSGASSWAEVVSHLGDTPLPPYIKRESESTDNERYQTVYSSVNGAVAAPTAGLHFTPEVLEALHKKGIKREYLTLHVSAGTFMPIKSAVATEHNMHSESIFFTEENIRNLLQHPAKIIAVGTTSCRSLESLYWYGVKLLREGHDAAFEINQYYPYSQTGNLPSRSESLRKILDVMHLKGVQVVMGHTSIYIYPGYRFQMLDGLITNFHQPNSTLLLLIAALIGDDWHQVYHSALAHDYRFLSYGDSSLLIPKS